MQTRSEGSGVRTNAWYLQSSLTSLLDPALGADNEDDDGSRKLEELRRLLRVNCLVRGAYRAPSVARQLLLAVDHTPASQRALKAALEAVRPADHLFIVHVWFRAFPLEYGYNSWEECPDPTLALKEDYRRWLRAKELLRGFQLQVAQASPAVNHTCIFLPAEDHREQVCRLVKEFGVSVLYLGKHGEADKGRRLKNWHWRSFRGYARAHAKGATVVVVQ